MRVGNLHPLLIACALSVAVEARGQVVHGMVRDSAGQGIDRAEITIAGTQLRAITDSSGGYTIRNVRAGSVMVRARRVGYWQDSLAVRVSGNTRADFTLRPYPNQLPSEIISADATTGKMGPFNTRRARGVGSFITRADIEKRQPASISEMLRYLPGVSVSQRMAGEPQPVSMQRSVNTTTTGDCRVQIYVDGHPYQSGNVDDFAPQSVEGIEVYRSASEIPGAFRTRDATCGVIAIWTRDPDTRVP